MSRKTRAVGRLPLLSFAAGTFVAAGLLGACYSMSKHEAASGSRGAGSSSTTPRPVVTSDDQESVDEPASETTRATADPKTTVAQSQPPAPPPTVVVTANEAPKEVVTKAEPSKPFSGSVGGSVGGSAGDKDGLVEERRTRTSVARGPNKKAPDQHLALGREVEKVEKEQTGEFQGHEAEINPATLVAQDRFSTFAVDVDTAAYSIARRTLLSDRLPTASLVRVEEMINYFHYDYEAPQGERHPFAIQADGSRSPADRSKHLLRVGLQARVVSDQERLPANLVFLVDTSCSMTSADKLELAKKSLSIAVDHLGAKDKVAITTYAGGVRVLLPPTSADQKGVIKRAIQSLQSGGGTAMESGLTLAYKQAAAMLRDNTITRIIVCSDGDANIGATNPADMLKQVAGYVSEGVTLSTIGYGDGNYKDATMEQIANKGNGNYYYIDSTRQAERVFGRDLTKMIQDVAQDVKIQIEFDSKAVRSYRLVGYENRNVADRDFRNDKVDAGEIGAGHQVTAMYELDLLEGARGSLGTIRVRAKEPRGVTAKETELNLPVSIVDQSFDSSPSDYRFAAAVMGGAELLRNSPHASGWSYGRVMSIVSNCEPIADPDRAEFLSLMKKAAWLSGESAPVSAR